MSVPLQPRAVAFLPSERWDALLKPGFIVVKPLPQSRLLHRLGPLQPPLQPWTI